MDKNLADLFRLAQAWSPQDVGIEVSGQQGGFIPWTQQMMIDKQIFFNIATENNKNKPGIRPNTNKMVRFNVTVPWFKSHMMYFPDEMRHERPMMEMMNELQLISPSGIKSKHDDFLDTISQLPLIQTFRPSEEQTQTHDETRDVYDIDNDDDEVTSISSYVV